MQASLKYDGGNAEFLKKFSAAGALTPGDMVVQNARYGVVSGTKPIAIGDDYTLQMTGVFTGLATSADVWADGDLLYWDDSTNMLTDVAGALKSCGIAVGAKASLATSADFDLNAGVASTTI